MNIISYKKAARFCTIDTYFVDNVNNATDEELIRFCDPNCFGGYVTRYANNKAMVEVNID